MNNSASNGKQPFDAFNKANASAGQFGYQQAPNGGQQWAHGNSNANNSKQNAENQNMQTSYHMQKQQMTQP
jgi:hypothetical protein